MQTEIQNVHLEQAEQLERLTPQDVDVRFQKIVENISDIADGHPEAKESLATTERAKVFDNGEQKRGSKV